jgi:uncharacterized protein YecE (DUF72 family)
LISIKRRIQEVEDSVKDIYIVMNNHPKGNAVANAFELLNLLKNREKVSIPETTLNSFERLKVIGQ